MSEGDGGSCRQNHGPLPNPFREPGRWLGGAGQQVRCLLSPRRSLRQPKRGRGPECTLTPHRQAPELPDDSRVGGSDPWHCDWGTIHSGLFEHNKLSSLIQNILGLKGLYR